MCPFTKPDRKTFCVAVVFGRLLGSDPLAWGVVQTEDPLREIRIPGRNVGKLTSLLYPVVLHGCMLRFHNVRNNTLKKTKQCRVS